MSDLAGKLHKLQADAGIPHLPTELTYECRMAVSGEGPRAFDWSDKPHRLVYDLSREVERLTETNAALMAERTSLIETKREQIERLTAEPTSALAKLAQYEQAPVVGWKLMHPLLHTRFSLHPITDGDRSLGWTDTALIARPEVTK